jgi:lipid A 4'-phosphatase
VSYLKRTRTWLVLGSFLAASMLLTKIPSIDLAISRLFFHDGFHLRDAWWLTVCHQGVTWFLYLSVAAVLAIYGFNAVRKRNLGGIDGRKICYLLLVLALGPGLIVNLALKDNFGRARPRSVVEFGGANHFTPAFTMSRECDTNCSFSSGEGAAAFFSLALAMALSRRRVVHVAAVAVGTIASFSRVASGAHFLSDVVVSFFIMLTLTDLLYYYIVLPASERAELPLPVPVPA